MKFRVTENLDAHESRRFQVEHSIYGRIWAIDGRYADQISAEIHMERLAAGPRVIASIDDSSPPEHPPFQE